MLHALLRCICDISVHGRMLLHQEQGAILGLGNAPGDTNFLFI